MLQLKMFQIFIEAVAFKFDTIGLDKSAEIDSLFMHSSGKDYAE